MKHSSRGRQFRWLVGGMEERSLTKKPALMVIAALIATHPVSDAEGMAPNAPEIWAAEGVGTCLYQIGSDKELADEDASYLTCLSEGANWCLYEARKQGIYDTRPYGAICWQKEADVWKESLSHLDDSLETNLKAMPHETGRDVPSRDDVIEAFSMAREGHERLIDARCALSAGASAGAESGHLGGGRAASEGLLLKGNGQGQLRPITALNSGIHIPGDQRSTAVADFNNDGKADLVIGQNGGETKLYLNSMERRGIRVNLIGSQQNPDAFGASIRLRYPQSTGPRRELQAGNGYLSRNAPTLILGYRQAPTEIEVTWPDGTQNVYPWNGEFDQTYTHQP